MVFLYFVVLFSHSAARSLLTAGTGERGKSISYHIRVCSKHLLSISMGGNSPRCLVFPLTRKLQVFLFRSQMAAQPLSASPDAKSDKIICKALCLTSDIGGYTCLCLSVNRRYRYRNNHKASSFHSLFLQKIVYLQHKQIFTPSCMCCYMDTRSEQDTGCFSTPLIFVVLRYAEVYTPWV